MPFTEKDIFSSLLLNYLYRWHPQQERVTCTPYASTFKDNGIRRVCSCFHLTNFDSVLCTLTECLWLWDSLLAFLLSTLLCVFFYYYYYSYGFFFDLRELTLPLSEIIPFATWSTDFLTIFSAMLNS